MANDEAGFPRTINSFCLYCSNEELTPAFDSVEDYYFRNVAGRFQYMRCSDCDSLVLVDPLAFEVLHEAYSEYYTHASPNSGEDFDIRSYLRGHYLQNRFGCSRSSSSKYLSRLYRLLAKDFDTIDRIGRYAPSAPATILDYGCGDGEFLLRMKEFGYSVFGVDFDPVCVRRGLDRGLSVFTPDEFADSSRSKHFDFISLAHVIEHVPDPKALLSNLADWLKPGGLLFLEAPNANALGLDVFGRYWRGLEAPRHLSIPSASGLLQMAEAAGFMVERQIVSQSLRGHLWNECLGILPNSEREDQVISNAEIGTATNEDAEFLTFLFRKN